MADEVTHCILRELDLVGGNPVLLNLSRNQILESDVDLLLFGITLQFDYFHAVAQGLGHRIEHVRSRDEQNLRKIERHIEVVVAERRVLLRIQSKTRRSATTTSM